MSEVSVTWVVEEHHFACGWRQQSAHATEESARTTMAGMRAMCPSIGFRLVRVETWRKVLE